MSRTPGLPYADPAGQLVLQYTWKVCCCIVPNEIGFPSVSSGMRDEPLKEVLVSQRVVGAGEMEGLDCWL